MAQYYTKPHRVEAWQYKIGFDHALLPKWVFTLIVNHRLGYRDSFDASCDNPKPLFQLFDDGIWVPVLPNDWIVQYDARTVALVKNEDFKESFEEVKAFPNPTPQTK